MKSIFLLWNLLISLATLKGGDGGAGANDTSSPSAAEAGLASGTADKSGYNGNSGNLGNFNGSLFGSDGTYNGFDGVADNNTSSWSSQEFTNDVTGQSGTLSYNEDGEYGVSYEDGTGFGYENDTSYEYGNDSSHSITFNEDGTIQSAYSSTNQPVGDYNLGVVNTYELGTINDSYNAYGYSIKEGLTFDDGLNGQVNVSENFSSVQDFGFVSFDTSLFGTVAINGVDLGLLGTLGYKAVGVKTGQVLSALSYGLDFYLGYGAVKTGMAMASLGFKAVGLTTSILGLDTMISSFAAANALFGNQISFTLSNSLVDYSNIKDSEEASLSLLGTIQNAQASEASSSYLSDVYSSDVYNGDIFEKLAGGILYDIKAAGNIYYDATDINNLDISVGGMLELSEHSKRVHIPYSTMAFPKSAGDDGWNIF